MESFYIKPVMSGILGGILLLLIYLLTIYGLATIFGTGYSYGHDDIADTVYAPTPTPTRDNNEVLIALFMAIYVFSPTFIALLGAGSVWASSTDRLTPLRLIYISAIPGAVSVLILCITFGVYYHFTIEKIFNQPVLWHNMLYFLMLPAIGTICSTIGGVIYYIISNKIKNNSLCSPF